MTAKEKAKELINKYLQFYDGRVNIAKKCALFSVDEILNSRKKHLVQSIKFYEYWNKVKQEIENL